MTIPLEERFSEIANYIALLIEAGAVLVVAFGAFQALMSLLVAIVGRAANEMRGREIWIKFATWILLALEFALAADLVRTAVAPTWDDISKLAVIATIRTMLNFSWRRTSPSSSRRPSGRKSAVGQARPLIDWTAAG